MDALAALAATPPRQYVQRLETGASTLQELYARCLEAGVLPATAAALDDISRLHSLFDLALDHGLGSLVLDYVTDVCGDRLLTSSDPVQAFLMDGECVRRWCHKAIAISKGRLTSWLGRGLGFISSSGTLPKEIAKLRALQLVVQALSPSAEQGQQAGSAAAEGAEVQEVTRLLQCGLVLAWLSQQEGLEGRPTGRFSSEQEWRGVASKRRDGAGAGASAGQSLFVADTLAALAQEGVPGLQYPLGSAEKLVGVVFLLGCTSHHAWLAKLSLLAYWLADGAFLQPHQLAAGFRGAFGVAPQLTLSWVLRLLLDDAHLYGCQRQEQAAGEQQQPNPSTAAAAALLPDIDGSLVPFNALQVFLQHGDAPTALCLLRQRSTGAASRGSTASTSGSDGAPAAEGGGREWLQEASVAVAVLLANGLLAEAFIQASHALRGSSSHRDGAAAVKRHLGQCSAAQQAQHAGQLLGQLLAWGLERGQLHAIIRLPLGSVEEQVACGWLASEAPSHPQCGLILVLYYLLRGRTPEALLAYAQHCPPEPAGEDGTAQGHLEELLRQAGSALPAVQRALALREAPEPALRSADDPGAAQQGTADGAEGGHGSLPLAAAVPGLPTDGQAPILTEGPSLLRAPLVGSVPALLALRDWQRAQQEGAAAVAALAPGEAAGAPAPPPVLGAAAAASQAQAQSQQRAAGAEQQPVQPPEGGSLLRQQQQLQGPAAAPPGLLPGGVLGGAKRPAAPARLGATVSYGTRGSGLFAAPAANPSGALPRDVALPEGAVGERDFNRLLGLQEPQRSGAASVPRRGLRARR
ncbi:hypothetical protein N2152v2_002730 [Parachlorella kessleri]